MDSLMWFFDLSHLTQCIRIKSNFFFVCLISAWLTQPPGKKCQQETRNTCKNKYQAPFSHTCYHSTYHKTNQNTNKAKTQFACYDVGCPTENIAIKVI